MASGYYTITIGGDVFASTDDVVNPLGASGGPNIETVQMFGGSAPKFINLGNTQIVRRFTVTRTHADAPSAFLYRDQAPSAWNGVKDVTIDRDGTPIQILAAKVEVEITDCWPPTTIAQLTITGGASAIAPS